MRQRLRLNASRKNGFSCTVSARALNVATGISLSGFDHQRDQTPTHPRELAPVAYAA